MSPEKPMLQTEDESQKIIWALGSVFRRRKVLVLFCLFGVLIPVVYYNETTEPIYEASTSIVFEELSGTVTPDVFSGTSRELQLFNRIEEMNSRAFAEDIARSLPDSLRHRFHYPERPAAGFDTLASISNEIRHSLNAAPLRNTNIVQIKVQMRDPLLCVAVANACQGVLQARNYRIRHEGVTDVRRFIEEQVTRFQAQLQESENALMQFKERHRITSLDAESRETLRKMTEAEVLYNETRANRGATRMKLASVEQQLAERRGTLVPSVTNTSSPSVQNLKDALVRLQTQYAQLSVQGYQESHPQLIQLRQSIDQTKKALADEALKLAKTGNTGDPIAQIEKLVQESIDLQIESESLKARENALKTTVEQYQRGLSSLPNLEVELARLVRERDVNQKIYTSLLENREEIRISEAKQLPNSRVIDQAEYPEQPILPRRGLNLAMGGALGLILGVGLGLFLESGRSNLRSMVEFEQATGWPVLATVPRTRFTSRWQQLRVYLSRRRDPAGRERRPLVSHLDPVSAMGESYFMLRTRLELLGLGTKFRTLMITSSGPRDGKSSTVSNLAVTFGAGGRPALLVDAELRRPVIHMVFGIPQQPGLSDLLVRKGERGGDADGAGDVPPDEMMFQPSGVEGVTVLPSGGRLPDTQWEVARSRMGGLLSELKRLFDVVLIDTAPPIMVHDTLALCPLVDAVVVVVDAQSYDGRRLMETKRLLERAGANIVGAVVNNFDALVDDTYYYSHRVSPATREPKAG